MWAFVHFFPIVSKHNRAVVADYENLKSPEVLNFGNHSYISFAAPEQSYLDSRKAETKVLRVKSEFESAHPELTITGWQVDVTGRVFYGIWVDHEPSGKHPLTRDTVPPKIDDASMEK